MKPIHYILIIAAIFAALYFFAWKKENQPNTTQEETKEKKQNPDPYSEADTSENADIAEISTQEALAIYKNSKNTNAHASQDFGDAPEYRWTFHYRDENNEEHIYIISQRTFKALVSAGCDHDIN